MVVIAEFHCTYKVKCKWEWTYKKSPLFGPLKFQTTLLSRGLSVCPNELSYHLISNIKTIPLMKSLLGIPIRGLNPIALRMAKTQWSFGHSEFNRVNNGIFLNYFSNIYKADNFCEILTAFLYTNPHQRGRQPQKRRINHFNMSI